MKSLAFFSPKTLAFRDSKPLFFCQALALLPLLFSARNPRFFFAQKSEVFENETLLFQGKPCFLRFSLLLSEVSSFFFANLTFFGKKKDWRVRVDFQIRDKFAMTLRTLPLMYETKCTRKFAQIWRTIPDPPTLAFLERSQERKERFLSPQNPYNP